MAKVSPSKLIVDNYSTEEVIDYVVTALKTNMNLSAEAASDQNNFQIGCALCNVDYVYHVLYALNEKLNGKKEATVVQ